MFHFLITVCKHNTVSNQHAIVFLLLIEKTDPEREVIQYQYDDIIH